MTHAESNSIIPIRAILRIPCNEPYAYIEIEREFNSNEEVVAEYQAITDYIKNGSGLSAKDFNEVIDNYLTVGDMDSEDYAGMNKEQMDIIQAIKRSIKRIKSRDHV